MNQEKNISCSFCGIAQDNTEVIIQGDEAYICHGCITKSYSVINEKQQEIITINSKNLKPHYIKEKLDQFVIGQEKVKKSVSVAVYNHYKRLYNLSNDENAMINIDKSNILLLGASGTGKTLIAKTLATILNVPFVIVDATVLTEAGYVGEDVDNILVRLYQESGYDINKTQTGIIYIDEIDKIGRKNPNMSITRDVSGEGVQQSLLKIVEGTIANIPPKGGRKHPEQPLVRVDTTNILFICGGTFDGIIDIIERRVRGGGIGFDRDIPDLTDKSSLLSKVNAEDIISYGFIPELMGRLPIVSALENLTDEMMLEILTKPKNSIIKQYIHLFNLDNVELVFSQCALQKIVELSKSRNTGARALRSVLEEIMLDIMYDIPSIKNIKSCKITSEVIDCKKTPILKYYKKSA